MTPKQERRQFTSVSTDIDLTFAEVYSFQDQRKTREQAVLNADHSALEVPKSLRAATAETVACGLGWIFAQARAS